MAEPRLSEAPRSRPLEVFFALSASGLVAFLLWALLRRSLFEGQAQSYDAPLYVRSLWGIAHGDFNNALIDYPSLAIHSQLALLVLAPFARVWHAADVLIAAQALAFGATLLVWLRALLRARRNASTASAALLVLWASVLFTYGMPLLANPFVFDVRPELLGVFLATAGLLRCAERERVDAVALVLLLVSAAAREEFALIAACALVLAPVARTGAGLSLRARAIAAGVLVVYFFGNSFLWPRGLAQAAHLSTDAAWEDLLRSKAMILAAFAGAAGGLALIGYRWLGAALPGLGVLMLSTWMARDQISFHYGMFVAPALLVASYAGFKTRAAHARISPAWLAAHVAIVIGCGVFLSALPGGARFNPAFTDLEGPVLSPATWRAHTPWLADVHKLLKSVPQEQSLWLPYMFATPYADRASIRVFEVENDNAWQPDAVLLPRKQWSDRGRQLREQGYKLAGLSGASYALLSRRTSTPLSGVLSAEGCAGAAIRWPDAGLELCNAWLEPDGRVMVVLGRSDARGAEASRGTELELRSGPGQIRLGLIDGLVGMDELPVGRTAWSRSAEPIGDPKVTFALIHTNGQAVPLVVQGQQKERITFTLLPPR